MTETVETTETKPLVDDGYLKYTSKMTEAQLGTLHGCCVEAGLIAADIAIDALSIAAALDGRPHVDVVVACSGVEDAGILEVLMSQPLSRSHPRNLPHDHLRQAGPHTRPNGSKSGGGRVSRAMPVADGTSIPAPSPDDPRIIAAVAPNPKKPSSAAYQRYNHYKVGISVAEFIRAGGTKDDVKYDVGKGFIRLVSPDEWASAQS